MMSYSTINGRNVPIRVWAPLHEVDSNVITQLKNVAALPWVAHHVAVMPDVHAGRGATVGSVIAMQGAVAPAAVGVDIGCGMAAVETSLTSDDLPDDLRRLRTDIERAIPVGRAAHREAAWESAGQELRAAGAALMDGYRARAASSTTRRSRTATWPYSWRGRRCSTPTAAISTGRRSTPASTAR